MTFQITALKNYLAGSSNNIGGQFISQNPGRHIHQGKHAAANEKLVGVNTKIGVGDTMFLGNGNSGKTYAFA